MRCYCEQMRFFILSMASTLTVLLTTLLFNGFQLLSPGDKTLPGF